MWKAWPGRSDRLLFVFAIACSAFLVFLVQPMVGKRLLPWYGGAPGVWTLCLAFYQATLFAGYAYAHGLMRLGRPWLELGVHTTLFGAALLVLPVLPDDAWRPGTNSDATVGILLSLAANVALPFLFLSATGPLVQAWFSRKHPSRDPYFLYAFSNAGSLLALVAYPFVVEPNLGLAKSGGYWALGFGGVGAAVLVCGLVSVLRGERGARGVISTSVARGKKGKKGKKEGNEFRATDVGLWIALAGVAVVLLMGITNQLCLDIASVPFLWMLPLAIYLLTFILCFSSQRFYRRWPFVTVAAITMLLLPYSESAFNEGQGVLVGLRSGSIAIGLYSLLLFATCMVAHGELYRRRPAADSLTTFYMSVSAGGALGGLFVGIGASRLLVDYFEVPIGIAVWWALALGLSMKDSKGPLRIGSPIWRKVVASGAATFLLFNILSGERFRFADVVHQERSFFGVLRVIESDEGTYPAHMLRHGTTLHGVQYTNALLRGFPTTYYGFASGIGLALSNVRAGGSLRVGVVGLGVGTLAAYGRPGDLYRFYEIDPAVISLARDSELFTFVHDSQAATEIVESDGRLALEEEHRRVETGWDLLILDAFSSDAIPVHLLTREAFALYERRLGPDGVLAIHVSNRHLDLSAVCFRLAESAGLAATMIHTASAPKLNSAPSRWVFAARDPERLMTLQNAVRTSNRSLGLKDDHLRVVNPDGAIVAAAPLWTDDYSDLLSILRAPPSPLNAYE